MSWGANMLAGAPVPYRASTTTTRCHGKQWSQRALARTSNAMCRSCSRFGTPLAIGATSCPRVVSNDGEVARR